MPEVLIAQLVTVIGKNGGISYNTVLGGGRLEVRPRDKEPAEMDLWFVPPWVEGKEPVEDTRPYDVRVEV
jgi:hypothetical protein